MADEKPVRRSRSSIELDLWWARHIAEKGSTPQQRQRGKERAVKLMLELNSLPPDTASDPDKAEKA